MTRTSPNHYTTPRYVAKALGFKPRTVTRWCREGKIEGAIKIGRVWRIPWDSHTVHLMIAEQNAKKEVRV